MRADGGVVRIVGTQGRVLEGQLAGVQVWAEELIGRLENGAMGKLRSVRSWIEIIGGWVWTESAAARRMMRWLLMELLLHGALFDVIGEFSWRHSVNQKRSMLHKYCCIVKVIEFNPIFYFVNKRIYG